VHAAQGMGLAAHQVGVSLRLIVVEIDNVSYELVNPEVVEASDETDIRDEGCLSLPNYYGPVERPLRVTVRALDRIGKRVKIKADDWLARCLQHEIDHLDGILFFDPQRMRSLSELYYRDPNVQTEAEEEQAAADAVSGTGRFGQGPDRSGSNGSGPRKGSPDTPAEHVNVRKEPAAVSS
jgi:peptide deformylase